MGESDNDDCKEPEWINPKNDRKTPYTEEEIERFVEDFILGLDDYEWRSMKMKFGESGARGKIQAGFVANDERNLINITPKGPVH